MKLRAGLLPAAAAILYAPLLFGQAGLAGHWEGVINVNGRDVTLSLDLAQNAKSEWQASLGVPSQKVTGLAAAELTVKEKSVTLVAAELRMAKLELTLDAGEKLAGTITSPQGSLPIEFKRTGEAKVELPPTSPAVSKELEGDWEGSVQAGDRTYQMTVHFRNAPDGTVAATLEIAGVASAPLPVNDVKQTGRKVEFGFKIGHAGFRGTLNEKGSEMAGEWTHETTSLPLTLKKK